MLKHQNKADCYINVLLMAMFSYPMFDMSESGPETEALRLFLSHLSNNSTSTQFRNLLEPFPHMADFRQPKQNSPNELLGHMLNLFHLLEVNELECSTFATNDTQQTRFLKENLVAKTTIKSSPVLDVDAFQLQTINNYSPNASISIECFLRTIEDSGQLDAKNLFLHNGEKFARRVQSIRISKVGDALVIHVDRLNTLTMQLIQQSVVPAEMLTVADTNLTLVAVIVFFGNARGGHYSLYVKRVNNWVFYDDIAGYETPIGDFATLVKVPNLLKCGVLYFYAKNAQTSRLST